MHFFSLKSIFCQIEGFYDSPAKNRLFQEGTLAARLPTRENTQKSKFLLPRAFKWKKIMFFVIPEMPSKTFVMLYKKLPDHFNNKKRVREIYAI